jgi:hypothetical protein
LASGSKSNSLCCCRLAKRPTASSISRRSSHLVAGLAEDAHVQARPLGLQLGDGVGDQVRRGAHDGAYHELAEAALPFQLQVFQEALQARARLRGIGHHLLPERRRPHATREALEQRETKRLLHVRQQLGRRRLRHVDHRGRLVQVAQRADRLQQRQVFDAQPLDPRRGANPPTTLPFQFGINLHCFSI